MPRSPVRRPADHVDLERYYRRFDSSPKADPIPPLLDSPTLFGNQRPLEIEIGSGKGLFLSTVSRRQPNHNFLGIEIVAKYATHAAGRLAKLGVSNAIMICGDAGNLLEKHAADNGLAAVHVYFPDPWWKKRHRKRRVVNVASVQHIARKLMAGGRLHFWTDVLDYFEDTIEMIAEVAPELGVPIPEEEIPATHDLDYRTHFERRSRQQNIPVYRVRYEKRAVKGGIT